MKALLIFASSLLISSSVYSQNKKNERLGSDTLALRQDKAESTTVESEYKKPIIFGYQYRTKNRNSDPFVLMPYRDSLCMKAVDLPNAYRRSADKSVDIPTYVLGPLPKSPTKPIASVEQLVKP